MKTQPPGHRPVFSVIIPTCFRSIEAVEKCLQALHQQTLPAQEFEILLVDDGSDQRHRGHLEKTLKEFFSYSRYLWQPNAGQGAARNLALKEAQGQLILFLNDDAVADPTLLQDHVTVHREHPEESVAVLGKFTVSLELPYSMFARLHSDYAYGLFAGMSEVSWRGFYTCNISVKRRFLEQYGTFDEQLRYYEDVELGYRLSKHGLKILYHPKIIAYHYHYLDENNFLGYGPFHAKALVAWYKKSPHLKAELQMYGFYPADPWHRKTQDFFNDLLINSLTIPYWKKLARWLVAHNERFSLALYKRIFSHLSRKTIHDELKKT
jgi:GT2 family glycosyltransferase